MLRIVLVFLLLMCGGALSQEPPKTPEVKTEQQPNSGLKPGPNAQSNKETTSPPHLAIPKVLPNGEDRECDSHCNNTEQERAEFWPPLFGYRFKITDSLLIAFTALLFFATLALWWSTRRLVIGAERTAERQLRAYIFIEGGEIQITSDGGGFIARITYKNFGQTPGHDFSTWLGGGTYTFDAVPFPAQPKPLSERVNRSIIAPGALAPVITESAMIDLASVRNKTKAIFVWGGADYVDAFKRKRHFIFRMKMSGPEQLLSNGGMGWPLTPHPLGYEAN